MDLLSLNFKLLVLVIISLPYLTLGVTPVNPEGKCIWYGQCGHDLPDNDDNYLIHWLNCAATPENGLEVGRQASEEDKEKLRKICPHFVEDFGSYNDWPNLCCDTTAIDDLVYNFELPESILSRCPACYTNFVKNFCDMTCRPDHSLFLRPENVILPDPYGKYTENHLLSRLCMSKKIYFNIFICKVITGPWFGPSHMSHTPISMKILMTLAKTSRIQQPQDQL